MMIVKKSKCGEKMIKEIELKDRKIKYILQYKNVKNINLRVKNDGVVFVSANEKVPLKKIEEVLLMHEAALLRAIDKIKDRKVSEKKAYCSEDEIKKMILEICEEVYPYFEKRGVGYPGVRFRKMVSMWGSCRKDRKILTFNTNLMYADRECVEYVVMHEFTHFLQPNHSKRFYEELGKICPCYKACEKRLKGIELR